MADIELILLQRIEKLGQMGDVVKVKPSYARNDLLPRKRAIRASKENLARFEEQRHELEALNIKRREEAERLAERMGGLTVVIIRRADDSGSLYGSVSPRDIADGCIEAGLPVTRQHVMLEHPIRNLGISMVRLFLHPEVAISVAVNVARSPEEAERQARDEMSEGPDSALGAVSALADIRDAVRFGEALLVLPPEAARKQERDDTIALADADLDAALAEAEARGTVAVARVLSADDMVSADQFAQLIGVTRETVHQKRRRGEVLGLEGPKRGVRFPIWQLTADHQLLPGLPAVFEKFDHQPWSVYRFLLQGHGELGGRSALEALKAGQVRQVLATADSIAAGVFN